MWLYLEWLYWECGESGGIGLEEVGLWCVICFEVVWEKYCCLYLCCEMVVV